MGMHMRALAMAAIFAAACSQPATAQVDASLDGVWAFQTQPYAAGQGVGAVMSGVAILRAEASGYAIQLLANELVTQGDRSVTITARETCRGEWQDAQFMINCELAEPLEGYQPDNFVLQAGEGADQLIGVLSSTASAQATFTRVR